MIEDIQLPDRGGHKVVQLYVENRPLLRIGGIMSKHAIILEDVLQELGLSYQNTTIRDVDVPALEGEKYRVVGMGVCIRTGDHVRYFGESLDYGIEIDAEHLQQCQGLVSPDIKLVKRR